MDQLVYGESFIYDLRHYKLITAYRKAIRKILKSSMLISIVEIQTLSA